MTNTQAFLDAIRESVKDYVIAEGTHLAVGTGTTAATSADTQLETEVLRMARQEHTEVTNSVVLSLLVGSTDANGSALTEVGVLDAAEAGNLMMRITFPTITKTADIDVWIDVEEMVDVTQ